MNMNMRALNLNLLPVLSALLEERNVTRAARRLGMTQPAVSNALAQLRVLLGDPILIRSGSRMVPSERALTLAAPLAAALQSLGTALEPRGELDPSTLERSFTLATTDYVTFVVLPKLLARLSRVAPGVRLRIQAWPHHRVPPSLERNEADLHVGFYESVPPGHRHERLFEDSFVCVVRRAHPQVGKRLTLATYLKLGHVLVTPEPEAKGIVDVVLERRGLERRVELRLPHFLMVPAVVASTDLVAALDRRVAEPFSRLFRLRLFPPPLALPSGGVGQVWHARTEDSPAHRWLRQLIREVTAGM